MVESTVVKLLSWNVNGIRAVQKKGFLDIFSNHQPDILCIQETKAHEDQLSEELTQVSDYKAFFCSAEKKGYSGVAIYSLPQPVSVERGFGIEAFDREGRILIADYGRFVLFNIYFPNGKASKERLDYKMAFYDAFLAHADKLKGMGRHVIICGDVNTAHKEIDLARPKENSTVSGFLPEERAWLDLFVAHGYVDTFRLFNQQVGQYSWWDYKTGARERNTGWRIDYFFVSESLTPYVKAAYILPEVLGSDHCPVGIEIQENI